MAKGSFVEREAKGSPGGGGRQAQLERAKREGLLSGEQEAQEASSSGGKLH